MSKSSISTDDALFDKVPVPVVRISFSGQSPLLVEANVACLTLTDGGITNLYGRDIHEIWQSPPQSTSCRKN